MLFFIIKFSTSYIMFRFNSSLKLCQLMKIMLIFFEEIGIAFAVSLVIAEDCLQRTFALKFKLEAYSFAIFEN